MTVGPTLAAKKIHPRDDVPSDGSAPEGDPRWREKAWAAPSRVEKLLGLIPKFSDIKKGKRLTLESMKAILDGCRLDEGEGDVLLYPLQ